MKAHAPLPQLDQLGRVSQQFGRVEGGIAQPPAKDHAQRRVEEQVFGMALRHRRAGQTQFAGQVPVGKDDPDEIGQRVPFDREKAQIHRNRRKMEPGEMQRLDSLNQGCRSVSRARCRQSRACPRKIGRKGRGNR